MKKNLFLSFLVFTLCFIPVNFAFSQEITQENQEILEKNSNLKNQNLQSESNAQINQANQNLQETKSENSITFENASNAIKNGGFFLKKENVLPYSSLLSQEEKNSLYAKYNQSTLKVGLLNGLVGFGLGSFLEKKWISGTSFLILDGLSVACITSGVLGILNVQNQTTNSGGEAVAEITSLIIIYPMIIAVGTVSLVVSRAIGAGVGVAVAKSYNKKLQDSLGLQNVELSFVPITNPQNYESGFALRLKI